jgi:hypothetical protein
MATKEDALRTISHSVSKKEPFTVDMLKVLYIYTVTKGEI